MVTKNGGYAIVKYNDSDIFAKVKNAYENEKPILFYDDDKTCFYVDSVKLNGDGYYEFTKGGKTWTVTDNNTLSSEGQIQQHLGILKVGYSGQDDVIYITNLISGLFTEFDDNFDGVEKIDGLYNVLKAIVNFTYEFEYNQQIIRISMEFYDNVCHLAMSVDSDISLQATVDSDDNITYTTNDDYFYIKYNQIF